MTEALAYLTAAVLCVPLAKRLGLGSVLGYLIAGAIIGPWGCGLIKNVESAQHLAEFGVVLMLFVIGLELEPKRLIAMKGDVFGGGILQVAVCGALLMGAILAMGWGWKAALVAGFALALSSTDLARLTMVDSAYLHWAFCPLYEYFFHFQRFSWNVAAIEHLTFWLRIITFLGKTVPIDRGGDDAHRKAMLNKLRWIVSRGEILSIFPEGTRSRTGRIDPATVTYGIGQILQDLKNPQVLCAYLRGPNQKGATGVPIYGDVLHLEVEVIEPKTDLQGLRGVRELSRQVIFKLKEMEDRRLGPAPADQPVATSTS